MALVYHSTILLKVLGTEGHAGCSVSTLMTANSSGEGPFLSEEEAACLEKEDEEFRAWRRFENRQHPTPRGEGRKLPVARRLNKGPAKTGTRAAGTTSKLDTTPYVMQDRAGFLLSTFCTRI